MKNLLIVALLAFVAAPFVSQAQNNRIAGPNKPQAAAVDYFLKLDGIDGESSDKKGEIQIESFSWGATNPRAGSGGGGAGKVSVHDISIMHKMDKFSTQLMQAAATGQHIKEAKLTCRKAGGDQQEYLEYTLENVLVSSYQTSSGNSAGDTAPTDSFSLNFEKIKFRWVESSGKPKNLGAGQTPQSVLTKFLKN